MNTALSVLQERFGYRDFRVGQARASARFFIGARCTGCVADWVENRCAIKFQPCCGRNRGLALR